MLPKNWVFLRGLAREKNHWGPFLGSFTERFPGTQVFALDYQGMGEHHKLESPKSIADIAVFAREQSRKHFGDQKVALFSISLGGMIAMEWMKQHEADLEAVVLVNSSAKQSAFFNRLRYQIWAEFIKVLGTANIRDREKKLLHLLMNSEAAKEAALPLWSKIALETPVQPRTFVRQLWAALNFKGLDKKPECPVLVLNSLGDRLVDPSCSEALHQKYQWQLERHPWAGHDLPWDDPEWVLNQVARFFA